LPVVDSLEKAVEAAEQASDSENPTSKAIIEGIGLCQKMLTDALGKESVVAVDPMGEPFDPKLHQALTLMENPNVEPNSVVMVVQKGYTISGRLVRPALVMVSKAPAPGNGAPSP
jgi:molecular chaperone GrpE